MRTRGRNNFSKSKIKTLSGLAKIISVLKGRGKKIVFTNGCFDLLHSGHAQYLEEAKAKGDILVVAVNSDSSVRRIKGKARPIVNEDDRARLIAALESVDYVVIFNEDTPFETISAIKPDILVKGADWKISEIAGADFVKKCGGEVLRVNLLKGRSTTNLIKKIVESFA